MNSFKPPGQAPRLAYLFRLLPLFHHPQPALRVGRCDGWGTVGMARLCGNVYGVRDVNCFVGKGVGMDEVSKAIGKDEFKAGLVELLYHSGGTALGYDLITDAVKGTAYSYESGKKALQSLRSAGVVIVLKSGDGKKKTWVAYQTLTLSKEAIAWVVNKEQASGEHFRKTIRAWMKMLGAVIKKPDGVLVGSKFAQDKEKWRNLGYLVDSGWVKLKIIPTADGVEWLEERKKDLESGEEL